MVYPLFQASLIVTFVHSIDSSIEPLVVAHVIKLEYCLVVRGGLVIFASMYRTPDLEAGDCSRITFAPACVLDEQISNTNQSTQRIRLYTGRDCWVPA